VDEEILQDFLVEASELTDQLDEQLTDLANNPSDSDLLNSIFRGFHTIKGGAGFLDVKPLIEVCHRAENIFDKIRNGDMEYDAPTADVIMRSFDVISDYIGELRDGQRDLGEADAALLGELDVLWKGGKLEAENNEIAAESEKTEQTDEVTLSLAEGVDPDGDMTDEEFEALLNQRDADSVSHYTDEEKSSLQLAEGVDPDGDMTDEEFEALLQQRDEREESGELTEEEYNLLLNGEDALLRSPSETSVAPEALATKPVQKVEGVAKVENNNKEEKVKPVATAETTVRVDTKRLDEIMNLVGELVLVRNRLLTLKGSEAEQEELSNAVANLDHVTTDLQNSVMKTRMQPVKKVFGRFPRVVRDLSRKLGKEIDLVLEGEETDLDKNLVEALADPLVHLVRNSVDHGVELPEDREEAGKSRKGTITLSAQQEGDHILLSITDDGKGMDPDMLRRKAVEKGLMDEVTANQLDDKSAFELIMAAGFSTAEVISDVSGRGVGMDVVKTMITKLNGSVDIVSEKGSGTQIRIRVPLTLAILPTLMVSFDQDSYAIPLTSVQEIFDYNSDLINEIDGQMMVRLREKSIPLLFLSEWLAPDKKYEDYNEHKVIIVSIGNQRAGLVIQHVNGQEEVVIKPLGVMMKHIDGYAGATITGNGSIALILDLPGVIHRFS
jgi:two-component system chemotaxis sensor kinase CheA